MKAGGGFAGVKVDCSVVASNLENDVTGGDVEPLGTYAYNGTYDAGVVTSFRIVKRLETLSFSESGELWDSRTDLIDTWADIDGIAGGSETDARVYIRHAQEAIGAANWSEWIPFDVLVVSARSFECKYEQTSNNTDTNIKTLLLKTEFYERT